MGADQQKRDGWQELQRAALQFAEGLVLDFLPKEEISNAYGRKVQISAQADVAYNVGLASTGLRTIAFVKGNRASNLATTLKQAVGQKLAMVVVMKYRELSQVAQLYPTGVFVLSARNWQEAADLMVVAHHVSELALIPAVVAVPENVASLEQDLEIPKLDVAKFLGNPDAWIDSPSPSQKLIFGEKRKRLPNWFDPDMPVTVGAFKNARDKAYETVAHQNFFESHFHDMLNNSLAAYSALSGRLLSRYSLDQEKKSTYLLVTTGMEDELLNGSREVIKSVRKDNIDHLNITLLSPLPGKELAGMVDNYKAVTVLEQTTEKDLSKAVKFASQHAKVYAGAYATTIDETSVVAALDRMLDGGDMNYWLNVPASKAKSEYPKHNVLLQHMNRDYPELKEQNVVAEKERTQPLVNKVVPKKVRNIRDNGPAYSMISRFYDDTALIYDTDELVADPFQSLSVLPTDTASFKNIDRQYLPKFNPQKYEGESDVFLVCPHGALQPLAISVSDMIKGALATSKANGRTLKSLVALTKTIATMANKELKANSANINYVYDFLPDIAEKVFKQKKLDGAKLEAAQADLNVLVEMIGAIPVSVTDTFFTKVNAKDPAGGELFTFGVDTSACIGCGICANACEDGAIEMIEEHPQVLEAAQEEFEAFENLPSTKPEVIERLLEDKDYDSLAAILLDRKNFLSVNGASSEHEPAQKVMLRLTAAIAELSIQPKVDKTIGAIDDLISKLETVIRKNITDALPTSDFDSLNESLKKAEGQRIPFNELISNWSEDENLKVIDTADLQLRMDLMHDLKQLKWAFEEGPTGAGRAKYSLLIDSSLKEFVPYPWSTFTTPALVNWDTSTIAMAEGLVKGCIRHTIDNVKIMRRAQLLTQKKYNPAIHDEELAGLTWADLTAAEKAVVMPVVLVARKEALQNNVGLMNLLSKPWPVKVIVIDDALAKPATALADLTNDQTQIIPLITQQKALIVKSSLADKEGLFNGLKQAMEADETALCWLLAPTANAHNTPWQKWPKLNAMAYNTRAFTHLYFNPKDAAKTLASAIQLESNPLVKADWNNMDLVYTEEGEEKNLNYAFTWADWAFSQHIWRPEFTEVPASTPSMPIADYINLDERKRKAQNPVIYRIAPDNSLQMYVASQRVVEATEAILKSWKVIQEMAGLVTAFPEKLREEVESEMKAVKDAEIKKLEKAHQEKIAALEGEYTEKMKEKIKSTLMELSKLDK